MAHPPVLSDQPRMAPVPLDTFRWPSGIDRSVVVLHAEPAELTSRYGIALTRDLDDRDDLDNHQVAVTQQPSGRPVMFIRYEHSPHPGTAVTIDRGDSLTAAWAELRSTLGIDDTATNWRSELMNGVAESA